MGNSFGKLASFISIDSYLISKIKTDEEGICKTFRLIYFS